MDDLRDRVHDDLPRIVEELSSLVAIPSIGYPGYDPAHVRASAELTREILDQAGFGGSRLMEIDGGHPAVFAEVPGPPGSPSVLLYAHHDVQPPGDPGQWTTPPFEPQIRDGRLFGRGSADDKCGIAIHAAALRALLAEGPAPCTIKVLVEGEEECSTEHLPQLVDGHSELLEADLAVIADGGNDRTGVPTIGTSVRGSTAVEVRVDVLPRAVHSGAFGGPLPDAITALSRMIATLHDDEGNVAVAGLHRFAWEGKTITEEEVREGSGVYEEVQLLGHGPLADRMLTAPAINVLAFESVDVVDAANQIVPTARAVVGLRLAPGEDGKKAVDALVDHLRAAAPWGVRVSLQEDEPGDGYIVDTTEPVFGPVRSALSDAFGGVEVVESGSGGSVPIVPMLARRFPGMKIVIYGAADHLSNYHSLDESVDLGELERMVVAEALMLKRLAASGQG
jgi:acetylornithine deacetylase/succinyl-diaminopimelate desuccinylase-like protein